MARDYHGQATQAPKQEPDGQKEHEKSLPLPELRTRIGRPWPVKSTSPESGSGVGQEINLFQAGPQMVMKRLDGAADKGAIGGLQSNRIPRRKKLVEYELLIRSDLRRGPSREPDLGAGRLWARLQAAQNVTAGAVFQNGQLPLHRQVDQISHHRLLVKGHAPYVAKSGRGKSPGGSDLGTISPRAGSRPARTTLRCNK